MECDCLYCNGSHLEQQRRGDFKHRHGPIKKFHYLKGIPERINRPHELMAYQITANLSFLSFGFFSSPSLGHSISRLGSVPAYPKQDYLFGKLTTISTTLTSFSIATACPWLAYKYLATAGSLLNTIYYSVYHMSC